MKKWFAALLSALFLALYAPALAQSGGSPLAPDLFLRGNPTTGYAWHFQVEDENVLAVIDNGFLQDEAPADAVGVGGVFAFRLSGAKAGLTSVTFRYARAWEEEGNAPAIVYRVSVDDALNAVISQIEADFGL